MPKLPDLNFDEQNPGMYSPVVLQYLEMKKAQRNRMQNNSQKRKELVAKANEDRVPELPVDLAPEPMPQPMQSVLPTASPTVSPNVPDMMPEPQGGQPSRFDPNTYQPEPTPKAAPLAGFAPQPSDDDELDSRKMLYDYLKNRRASEPAFQEQYKELSRDAETGRVLSQWASGLGEMASMAGTLQGKRADVGDTKSLPAAIYGGMRRNADELMGLRRLSNNEQVSDIRMLRDIERGDLDALRTQKILQDMNRQRQQPKTLPYFVPGDDKNPPRMVMMDSEGNLQYRELPPGARPSNETYMMGEPVYVGGRPVYPQTGSKTGQTTFVQGPEGAKTAKQIQFESQSQADEADRRLKEIEAERKNANDADRRRLDQEELNLKKAKLEWEKSQGKSGGTATESERKNAMFSTIILDSLKKIEEMENGNPELGKKPYRPGVRSTAGNMFGGTGTVLGNKVLGSEDRAYDTLANTLIEPILRSWTGAAAQKDEIKRAWASYKILPGDDERTIKIKQEGRRVFAKGLIEASGRAKENIGASQNEGVEDDKPERFYNKKLNKTRLVYPDGRIEEFDGVR